MIENLQALGLTPGRAWAVSVGRVLIAPSPDDPKRSYKWKNHVAPTVPVEGAEQGLLVIDPSLSRTGPFSLTEWAGRMGVKSLEISNIGLSQAEILGRQSARALQGRDLDAMVFCLRLGEPPIPEAGGSGFWIDKDPLAGPSAYVRQQMKIFLDNQAKLRPGRR
jgi:hypothetical protein